MDIILKNVSTADLQYLRGSLEARFCVVRSTIDKVSTESKNDSDVSFKDFYASCLCDLHAEYKSIQGLLDML